MQHPMLERWRDVLAARGFETLSERYDERRFGNAVIGLRRGGLYVRLVRVRDREWMEVSDGSGDWFNHQAVLELLGVPGSPDLLLGLMDDVGRVFAPQRLDDTKERLRAIAQARTP